MMNNIKIKGFKCFESTSLPLSSLTLLTGFNAAGKSTLIQSILLIAQAVKYGDNAPEILLNGPIVSLGAPADVFHQSKIISDESIENIEFEFSLSNSSVFWRFEYPKKREYPVLRLKDFLLQVNECNENQKAIYSENKNLFPSVVINELNEFDSLVYLSACRLGTLDVFPMPSDFKYSHTNVGVQGEYAPWLMEQNKDEDIDTLRAHNSDSAVTLRRQLNAWLSYILPNSEADTKNIDKASLVQLFFRSDNTSEWRRPANIGFGLTYVFPILIAGLLAKKGQILIVDSPEAHLHPLGQSRIGEFLSQMASSGVQIIIETHSDHVLNGVRLAVSENKIDSVDVAIHFFEKENNTNITKIISPLIDDGGNLSEWPEGFFDQADKDLGKLIGW